jgi:lactate racemase
VAGRLGFDTAKTIREAPEKAKDVAGPSPAVTCHHYPPIFLCDVE